jgi:uncharacterized protein (DUF2237 family)
MENFKVFIGEDFALCGEVTFTEEDSSQTLDDFDIVAELSTTALGSRVMCSTMPGKGLTITRSESNRFSVNVPHAVSKTLSAGDAILSLAMIHKSSGVRMIAEQKTITLIESHMSQQL